jgi:2-polyprenyl-3-methyl-5-hydroxy-6-metoxy-1,4-benzoquinol methylase
VSRVAATWRAAANAVRRSVTRVLPYRPMAGGRELLDAQYAAGDWDYLRDLSELSRFSVIAGYCHHIKPGGSILEVGCGEGLLTDRLDKAKYSRYVGVDISTRAIAAAAQRQDAATAFVAGDAMHLEVPGRFDVVVFNECLEYFADPRDLLRKYEASLEPNGVYIASIFDGIDTARSRKIWRMFRARYDDIAETRVRNQQGYAWSIRVLRPSGRS